MNERYRLDSEKVRKWLEDEDRKMIHLVKRLSVSGTTVHLMLTEGHVPKDRTLNALAQAMGVEAETLLVPIEAGALA